MIYSLRKKFIKISMLSVSIVFLAIYIVIGYINVSQMNERTDAFTDIISENNGRFPKWDKIPGKPGDRREMRGFMTPDSGASTRFFMVWFDHEGEIVGVNMDFISSVTKEEAKEFAKKAVKEEKERGWISYYRYKAYDTERGKSIVFVDGHMTRSMTMDFMLILGVVFIGSILGILALIVLFSKRAVKPIAESYEKQKQFITDANHELKTPLTLILTNLDILEAECGKNEWVEDMRVEGMRMTELVNRLVSLSKMDEEQTVPDTTAFCVSNVLTGLLEEFQSFSEVCGIQLAWEIMPDIDYVGDEQAITQLFSILMDNALKYCDENGQIFVSLKKRRYIEIRIENSFKEVKNTKLDKLFDRFYREDQARTAGESFGIGLSIAKAIVEKHKGEIRAYKAAEDRIGFEVILKNRVMKKRF